MVEAQLAPNGARVTESCELRNSRGRLREIDVVIELDTGPRLLTVGVEVTESGRPADSEWVEQIHGKHSLLQQLDKTVLVSKNGFTKAAKDEALSLGMQTLTLEDAMTCSWAKIIHSLPTIGFRGWATIPKSVVVLFDQEELIQEAADWNLRECEIEWIGNEQREACPKCIDQILQKPVVEDALRKKMVDWEMPKKQCVIEWAQQGWLYREAGDATRLRIVGLRIVIAILTDSTEATITKGRYADVAVAHGHGKIFGQRADVVFVEREGDDPHVSLQMPQSTSICEAMKSTDKHKSQS